MAERAGQPVNTPVQASAMPYVQDAGYMMPSLQTPINITSVKHGGVSREDADIQDTGIYVEEAPKSLDEVEKEMIRKALARHNGRRKNAAKDLNISERTLYRKIKEYGLE